MKNSKGITLIALVITIIVMLILVAITIQITLGENGIISKAKEARIEQEKEAKKEEVTLAIAALVAANEGNTDNIKPSHIVAQLDKIR